MLDLSVTQAVTRWSPLDPTGSQVHHLQMRALMEPVYIMAVASSTVAGSWGFCVKIRLHAPSVLQAFITTSSLPMVCFLLASRRGYCICICEVVSRHLKEKRPQHICLSEREVGAASKLTEPQFSHVQNEMMMVVVVMVVVILS